MGKLFDALDDPNNSWKFFKECRWCGCRYGKREGYAKDTESSLPFCSKKCEAEAIAFHGKQKEANKNQPKSGKECKVCGTEPVGKNPRFCLNCGLPLSTAEWSCACDPSLVIKGDFCPTCGRRESSCKIY